MANDVYQAKASQIQSDMERWHTDFDTAFGRKSQGRNMYAPDSAQ